MVDVDVTDDGSLDACFQALKTRWGHMDFLIHAIAYSDKNELTGRFINTSRATSMKEKHEIASEFEKFARLVLMNRPVSSFLSE